MKESFDSINKALNTSFELEVDDEVKSTDIIQTTSEVNKQKSDITRDYEYTRSNLYSLIEKGQEAINGIMEVADEGGNPRAYEVAGQLIKSVGDVTDKLIDLQKKLKDVEDPNKKTAHNVTNNAVFVGSTTELSKFLKQGFLNSNE